MVSLINFESICLDENIKIRNLQAIENKKL